MSRFNDKVVLISGGGTGIGRATAEAVVAEGGRVVVTGRREQPLEALSKEFPDRVRYVTSDVSSPDGPREVVAYTIEQCGRLDVLINNAAVGFFAPLAEMDDDSIDRIFDINVKGLLRMSREALPHLVEAKGAVVNISSIAGQNTMAGNSLYASSKAAVDHVTKCLAQELGASGVRVNAVSPGYTDTDMVAGLTEEMHAATVAQTPLGRVGQPADIAKAILFLASDEASWITGQVLQSTGGLML